MANYKDKLKFTYFFVMIVLLSNKSDFKDKSTNPSTWL